ncbi:MBL fold metallo-hydrolase [Hoyosella sp. G463]|uniref:MBL fold metallo-hydrolase n=1 Tax=Lolliginicoccus lacisalsi TaxID=2742202 RepID=A0A927JBY8_9ACTN|nr:MBL fold metallo-hydrolase [Lolliginicoccus lacisalsi]MBD8506350.1 MBL fold metallo-hydrolase [Lolliginicoccus lacisalsi]
MADEAGIPVPIDNHYTGATTVGGPAQLQRSPTASIYKLAVGPMDNNTYLVVCERTGEGLLIDAANEASRIASLAEQACQHLALIITTHRHQDHWQALADVAAATGAPTAAHSIDADPLPVQPDRLLADGDTIAVGDLALQVIHLRGHTPGSIALALVDGGTTHLFSADNLFPGGPGKTTTPDQFSSLMNDLENKVFGQFPDDTKVYPGHGKDTMLGTERPHFGEWRARGW